VAHDRYEHAVTRLAQIAVRAIQYADSCAPGARDALAPASLSLTGQAARESLSTRQLRKCLIGIRCMQLADDLRRSPGQRVKRQPHAIGESPARDNSVRGAGTRRRSASAYGPIAAIAGRNR